jgi:hypothetical protein
MKKREMNGRECGPATACEAVDLKKASRQFA